MPQGEGTYGSQVGRPKKNKSSLLNDDDRERYFLGGIKEKLIKKFGKEKTGGEGGLRSIFGDFIEEIEAKAKAEAEANKDSTEYRVTNRPMFAEGGELDNQMEDLMPTHTMPDGTEMPGATHEEYEQMLPDEEMEADYVDFIVNSTLSEEDQNYLESALTEDTKLSELFDQVVESASEFSGSGPIEGPGSEVSDSIPARLSDGEFVFTAKATDEIGADNLQRMMEDAEAGADERQGVAYGGEIDENEQQSLLGESVKGTAKVEGNIPSVLPLRATEEELHKSMLQASPRQYYRPTSG